MIPGIPIQFGAKRRPGDRGCEEKRFMPYMEYMNRVYSQKPVNENEVDDWGGETDDLNSRLVKTVKGPDSGSVAIDPYTVHAFFDRLEHSMPEFVPSTPAAIAGAVAGYFVFKEVHKIAMFEYVYIYDNIHKDKPDLWRECIEEATDKGHTKGRPSHTEYAVRKYKREGGKFEREVPKLRNDAAVDTVATVISGAKDVVMEATGTSAMNDLTVDSVKIAQRLLNERWRIIILLGVGAAGLVGKFVFDKVYLILLLRRCKNRKHWAAIKFAGYYANGLGLKQPVKIP